jgi:hypothetical protein
VGAGRDRTGQARFANVPKNPLILRGVYKTVCQFIRLINKKNFNPSPSSAESAKCQFLFGNPRELAIAFINWMLDPGVQMPAATTCSITVGR